MKLIITGSAGQLGGDLMYQVGQRDHIEVLGLDLPACDLTNRDGVLAAITEFSPDAIIHAAAFTAVDLAETEVEAAYLVNAVATRFIADGARRTGAHLVYVSTDYVFDGTKTGAYQEWDRPNPQSVYGLTKWAGETEIDPGHTVARASWVMGPNGTNMLKTVAELAKRGEAVRFVDDQRGNPTFSGDLAAMLLKLAVERVPGTFHTTNRGAVSWFEFARTVYAEVGADPELVSPCSSEDFPRPAPRPANSVLGDLAWRGHGFTPSRDFRAPLREALRQLA